MTDKPGDDPLIAYAIERALEPYLGILPPSQLEALKRTMRFGLASHPEAQELLRRLRVRQVLPPQQTGVRRTRREGEDPAEDAGDLGARSGR